MKAESHSSAECSIGCKLPIAFGKLTDNLLSGMGDTAVQYESGQLKVLDMIRTVLLDWSADERV